ncbi:MAG: alpha/beta hydrolase [Anaerolineales bacterium]|nr:alpha/beta hydrolase [Anaerolineales bacterium]
MWVNNRHLHVEVHGSQDDPALVLLHHGLGSTHSWKDQSPALAEAGWRVIVYDRWGYGRSQARAQLSVPGFEDDLADLEALLQAFDVEKVVLVGHSDGGTIALYFAARNPARVACLATVAAHIYVEPKMETGIEGIRAAYQNEVGFRRGMQVVHGEKAEAVFSNWYNGWCRPESLAWDMRPLLGAIQASTLVVQGMEDEHATPQHARDISDAIPTAALWLADGAKHMFPQDEPERFNARLLEFLHDSC